MMFNGYWVMDNLQIFDNVSNLKEKKTDHMASGHTFQFRITQSTPMLYICLIASGMMIMKWVIPERLLILKGMTMKT
jgi:hypothetical protein